MKKVLIVTYYWPPAGGPGVQRVLNFARHLPENDWEPLVLTVRHPCAPAQDESLLARIPGTCRIYKTKTREPFGIYKVATGRKKDENLPKTLLTGSAKNSLKERIARRIRANIFVPDARIGWKPYLVRKGMEIIRSESPDIIFSTSPPHSLQLGTMELASRSGIPWVADLRDPWTEAYWETLMPKSRASKRKNGKMEHRVLSSADRIVTVSEGMQKLLQTKTAVSVSVIYSGYRKLDLAPLPDDCFEIVHIGNLSAMQSVGELLHALSLLQRDMLARMRLVFIGNVDRKHREAIAARESPEVRFINQMPYEEMIRIARRAAMLFIPPINSSYADALITAKLFDYLALRKPIISFTTPGSDIARVLDTTRTGKTFTANQGREAAEYISTSYRKWILSPDSTVGDSQAIEKYSTEANVRQLAVLFNALSDGKDNIHAGDTVK